MKSATAHEPGVHGVHEPPSSAAGVYSTRIRKTKRRTMTSAPSSSRGRTRASDLKDPSSQDSPARDGPAADNPKSDSPPAHPNTPTSPTQKDPSPNQSPAADSPLEAKGNQKHHLQKNDKNDKKSKDNSLSAAVPSSTAAPSGKSSPWRIDEIVALAKQVLVEKTTDPAKMFPGSGSNLTELLPSKKLTDLSSVIDHFKAPFDASRLPFAPKCGVSELAAALASQHSFLTSQKTALDAANAKYAKERAERQHMEKSVEKLKREVKNFSDEIEQEKAKRAKATAKRDAAEVTLKDNKSKEEKEREAQAARREDLVKAKSSELEMRRRLDRMRLKVAALRGEMITPTVDLLFRQGPKTYGCLDGDITVIESDPLVVIREGVPLKRKAADTALDVAADRENAAADEMEVDSGNSARPDDPDLDEDAEETQLRLLRNRLAMCVNEAREWADTRESLQASVQLVTKSKARLEEETVRLKQPGSGKSGGSGRGVGKVSLQNARNAAKLRAAARAAFVPAPDLGQKKNIKKNRKGRPRKSLVPY